LLDEAGAIQRRRNGLNRKIGNRMRNHALLAGHPSPCRRCPHSGVWLFQRDFASQYMADHGKELVVAHNELQLGQGVLRFPKKRDAVEGRTDGAQ
jgi:anti-repressor protein